MINEYDYGEPDRYEYFDESRSREELYQIAGRTAEYMKQNDVKNIVLLDRSARPAYIALLQYWRLQYPDEKPPSVFFLNPDGFKDAEMLMQEGELGLPVLFDKIMIAEQKGLDVGAGDIGRLMQMQRSNNDIDTQFASQQPFLNERKGQKILVFDTCLHSGDSIRPVKDALHRMGFSDVMLGFASTDYHNEAYDIQPDFVALDVSPAKMCYPFERDTMTKKPLDSTIARKNDDPYDQYVSKKLRREIKRVIHERWKEHANDNADDDDAITKWKSSSQERQPRQTSFSEMLRRLFGF